MDISRPASKLPIDDTLHLQRFLKGLGYYSGKLDGQPGPLTARAAALHGLATEAIAAEIGRFDPRSETAIAMLHPVAQRTCRQLLVWAQADGHDARILAGMRSYAQQNALYAQGRSGGAVMGKVITKARGGQSYHNFGLAWDIGLFCGGVYVTAPGPYRKVAEVGQGLGLDCGAFWEKFPDAPHYQLPKLPPIDMIRRRFEAGEATIAETAR